MESAAYTFGGKRKFSQIEQDDKPEQDHYVKAKKVKYYDPNEEISLQIIGNQGLECYREKLKNKDCIMLEGTIRHGSECSCMEF